MRQYKQFGAEIDIAWAAGLFEGEGTAMTGQSGKRHKDGMRNRTPHLSLGSTDYDVLYKFWSVLGERGAIYGPYLKENRKPFWKWEASWRAARDIATQLWPYMCSRRAGKFTEVFGANV